jgi:abortive infection bacteriophage resistance protein
VKIEYLLLCHYSSNIDGKITADHFFSFVAFAHVIINYYFFKEIKNTWLYSFSLILSLVTVASPISSEGDYFLNAIL